MTRGGESISSSLPNEQCVITQDLTHMDCGTSLTAVGLTRLPAGFTVSTVTGLLAAVETTAELVATDQLTSVVNGLSKWTQRKRKKKKTKKRRYYYYKSSSETRY